MEKRMRRYRSFSDTQCRRRPSRNGKEFAAPSGLASFFTLATEIPPQPLLSSTARAVAVDFTKRIIDIPYTVMQVLSFLSGYMRMEGRINLRSDAFVKMSRDTPSFAKIFSACTKWGARIQKIELKMVPLWKIQWGIRLYRCWLLLNFVKRVPKFTLRIKNCPDYFFTSKHKMSSRYFSWWNFCLLNLEFCPLNL